MQYTALLIVPIILGTVLSLSVCLYKGFFLFSNCEVVKVIRKVLAFFFLSLSSFVQAEKRPVPF